MKLPAVLSVFLAVALVSCGGEFDPETPGNLTATTVSPVKINLSWDASTDDIELYGYRVYRGGALITEVQQPSVTYNDTGLKGNTEYCYQVSALDGADNESDKSDDACATTSPDTTPPQAPSGLKATAASYSQANLSWNPATDDYGLEGYKIYRYGVLAATSGAASFSDLGLDPSTTYCYTVSAYDTSGNESSQSGQTCVTTLSPTSDIAAPYPPQGLGATLVTSKRVEFSWDASSDDAGGSGIAGYKVYWQNDLYASPIAILTENSFSNTGLSPDIKYCYRVSAYDNAGNESVKSAEMCAQTLTSPQWVISSVDKVGDVGMYASTALDPQNIIHMAYYDYSNDNTKRDLKYATKNGALWEKTVIDSAGDVGMFASIAVDSNGKAHISYYDFTNDSLKYATNASGTWVAETVDTGGVGWDTSIVADSIGNIHISYYDYISGDLKYVQKDFTGAWTTPVAIDGTGDVGQFSSIAVDKGNNIHISYYDSTNGTLKYANGTNSVFSSTTADSGGGNFVGWYSSIAADSNNLAHISYYDISSGSLKYCVGALSSGFTPIVVDTGVFTLYVEDYTSIHVDSSNNAHISYYDGANGDLKYATGTVSGFTNSAVDSGGGFNVGSFNSIAGSSDGSLNIGYYDYDNGDLKYAIFE